MSAHYFGIAPVLALDLVNALTPRQREVAERIAMGETQAQIAKAMKLSPKMIESHLAGVRAKWRCTTNGIPRIWFAAKSANEDQP